MTQFKAGDKYEALEGACAHLHGPESPWVPKAGDVVTIREVEGEGVIDHDGDVRVILTNGHNGWCNPAYLIRWLDEDEDDTELNEPFFDDQWVPETLIESVTLDPRRVDAMREATSTLLLTGTPTPEAIVVLAGFLLGEITPREVYA